MPLFPDPRALELTARRLDEHADELRLRAGRLAATTQSTQWASTASRAFGASSTTLSSDLRRCASAVDDASAALRAHARTIQVEVAMMEQAVAAAVALEQAAVGIAEGVVGVAEGVVGVAEGVAQTAVGVGRRALHSIGF